MSAPGGTVAVVVNPLAGKDVRRLVSAASHTSDAAKIGIVRRVLLGAAEAGATRLLLAPDPHHLGARAADGLDLPVEILDLSLTASRADTVAAARLAAASGAGAIVVLGGDGTCRDVAKGWQQAPLIAISTGTNNVFPRALDGTSAGAAAALVARGAVDVAEVACPAKRVVVRGHGGDDGHDRDRDDDLALVDLALVEGTFTGARAVRDPQSIRAVVAAIASPASTGLSSIPGRLLPCGRDEPGGVLVRLGAGGRRVRVPLSPGAFVTVEVVEVRRLAVGEPVCLHGPGLLAFDGERDVRLPAGAAVEVRVEGDGPLVVDVERALAFAACRGMFEEDPDGR